VDAASLTARPLERAAFGREARPARFAALVLDLFAFGFLTFVVNSVFGVTQVTSTDLNGTGTLTATTTAVAWPWLTLLGVLYFAVPEAMFGASIGKQIMGLKVVRADGAPLALRDVLIRNVVKPIDFLPLLYLLGGVFVLATDAAQRLGDVAAGTTVVHRARATERGATRTSGSGATATLAGALAVAAIFTAAFDYFGRPPLVVAGAFNAGQAPLQMVDSYRLGQPSWGLGHVTYPMTVRTRISPSGADLLCHGSIALDWDLAGWHIAGAGYDCAS